MKDRALIFIWLVILAAVGLLFSLIFGIKSSLYDSNIPKIDYVPFLSLFIIWYSFIGIIVRSRLSNQSSFQPGLGQSVNIVHKVIPIVLIAFLVIGLIGNALGMIFAFSAIEKDSMGYFLDISGDAWEGVAIPWYFSWLVLTISAPYLAIFLNSISESIRSKLTILLLVSSVSILPFFFFDIWNESFYLSQVTETLAGHLSLIGKLSFSSLFVK